MKFTSSPEKKLKKALKKGEISYCLAVCEIADEADSLLENGNEQKAINFYRVISALDIDDKTITEVVDHARTILEQRGEFTEPSIDTEYKQYLDSLPPKQRYLMLARQCISGLSSNPDTNKKIELEKQAIQNFEKAMEDSPLGKKDLRIYNGLKHKS